jgi:hypothetical protein
MKIVILHFVLWVTLNAYACGEEFALKEIGAVLIRDDDFKGQVCTEQDCPPEELLDSVDVRFERGTLDEGDCLYIVEPKVKAKNMFIGVLTSTGGLPPQLEMMFWGGDIKSLSTPKKRFPRLAGREHIGEGRLRLQSFDWVNGHYSLSKPKNGRKTSCAKEIAQRKTVCR